MKKYDVAVIGAGIIGLAVAREILVRQPGTSIAIVEKEPHVAAHQTGHNSGVVHGGIYYAPGSLKARLCVDGAALMYEYAQEHGIPHDRCGKLIVALDKSEIGNLDELERRGRANGVSGLRRVDGDAIREIEPHATGLAALHAPNTGIIDYVAVAKALHRELVGLGATFHFDTRVTGIHEGASCQIETDRGPLTATRVIACAGLWSDRLARYSGASADPRIVPFRGVYLRVRPDATSLVRGMIYPVPDPALPFLGVHLTRHISGHLLLGPTAMVVPSRDSYRFSTMRPRDMWETATWPGSWRVAGKFWRTGLEEIKMAVSKRAYVSEAARYVPELRIKDLDNARRAGVRAQAVDRAGNLVDDFVISQSGSVAHVRNAPSPAATSAFSLAVELVDRVGFARPTQRR